MKAKPAAPDLDLAKWCAALATPVVVDEVPPGWVTVKQLAAQLGKSDTVISHRLSAALSAGRAERREFRITSGLVTRPVPHYRLK